MNKLKRSDSIIEIKIKEILEDYNLKLNKISNKGNERVKIFKQDIEITKDTDKKNEIYADYSDEMMLLQQQKFKESEKIITKLLEVCNIEVKKLHKN